MKRATFAGRIRVAVAALAERQEAFTVKEIVEEACIQTRKDEKKMHNAMLDFMKAGEVERLKRGVYRLAHAGKRPGKKRTIHEKMWWLLRVRKAVSVADLQEMAGASENYAKEWLQMLARREVVQKLANGRYQLINEPVEIPVNDEKAEKLRRLRAEKKALIDAALKKAGNLLDEARNALKNLD